MPSCTSGCYREHWYGFVYLCLFVWDLRVTHHYALVLNASCFVDPIPPPITLFFSAILSSASLWTFLHRHLNICVSLSTTNIFFSALYTHSTMALISCLLLKQTCWICCFYLLTPCLLFSLVSCSTKTNCQHIKNASEHFQTSNLFRFSAAFDTFVFFFFFLLASLSLASLPMSSYVNILFQPVLQVLVILRVLP